jgi:hypothetical protein
MKQLKRHELQHLKGGLLEGGSGQGTCAVYLPNGPTAGSVWSNSGPNANFTGAVKQGNVWTFYGVSQTTAQTQVNAMGGHWCCASCATASWYHPEQTLA